MDGCSNIHGRRIAIILRAMVLLLVLTTTPRLAVASPVQATCKDVMTVDLDFINTSIPQDMEVDHCYRHRLGKVTSKDKGLKGLRDELADLLEENVK
jgi:hypothetical protein